MKSLPDLEIEVQHRHVTDDAIRGEMFTLSAKQLQKDRPDLALPSLSLRDYVFLLFPAFVDFMNSLAHS